MGGQVSLYEKAVEYILTMPKTEKAVRLWLSRKTVDKNEIENIIAQLKEYNFVDDTHYAELFTEAKRGKMAVGMIKNKLLQNGVKYNIVETAIADVGDQRELANATAEKYLRNKPKTQEVKNKLFRHLLCRGFDYELCREISNECWKRFIEPEEIT